MPDARYQMPDAGSLPFVVSFVVNLVDSSTQIPTKFAIKFTTKNDRDHTPDVSRRSSESEGGCQMPACATRR